HHFVLDGAIWKLRGPIARVLIQSETEQAEAPAPRRAWLGRAAWAACGVALVANLAGVLLEDAWTRALRDRDLFAARAALGDLFWVGRDRASYHLAVARGMLQVGAHEAALAEARKAADDSQSAEPHVVLGQASLALGRPEDAARAFEAASALAPERAGLRRQAARAWKAAGRSELALAQLEAAARLAPGDASLARELSRARAAALATSSAAP
ncbi:MAG TPA: hypothetical protein VFT98_22070, partial [Myxococcota bacterium]|nr:hypothetical protein [Myxococcota bacterium]